MADQLITGTTLIEDKRSERGEVYSINASQWRPQESESDDVTVGVTSITANGNGITFRCPINLPQGAKIISVIIYGNAGAVAGETFVLDRLNKDSETTTVVAANTSFGTEQATIVEGTINNNDFTYALSSSSLDITDAIFGGVIKYEF